jgi:hypothetical protein
MARTWLKTGECHNWIANLDASEDPDFEEICGFLSRSVYSTALTISPKVIITHMDQFWANCTLVTMPDNTKALRSEIQGRELYITPNTIRTYLRLGDNQGVLFYPEDDVDQTFREMGYEGNVSHRTKKKGLLSPQWKFLVHTILVCLSNKTGGTDQMSGDLCHMLHGLVRGLDFDYATFVFNALGGNIDPPLTTCTLGFSRPSLMVNYQILLLMEDRSR